MLRNMAKLFPYYAQGKVVKGFGRGSKELGIPTANFPDEVVENLPEDFDCGVYYGWASVNSGGVHKMVMSVGWNPFYKNTKRSMETHILHKYNNDFYGDNLKICITGYVRPEMSFDSLDSLITAIKSDISIAEENLDKPDHIKLRDNTFFKANISHGL